MRRILSTLSKYFLFFYSELDDENNYGQNIFQNDAVGHDINLGDISTMRTRDNCSITAGLDNDIGQGNYPTLQ